MRFDSKFKPVTGATGIEARGGRISLALQTLCPKPEPCGQRPRRTGVCPRVNFRYGHEYSGGWIISSPRNLPGVDYEPLGLRIYCWVSGCLGFWVVQGSCTQQFVSLLQFPALSHGVHPLCRGMSGNGRPPALVFSLTHLQHLLEFSYPLAIFQIQSCEVSVQD